MKRIVLPLTIIAALASPILHATDKLELLATIKPIHSLVAVIGGELANTKQIIQSNASPHHYNLRPSDLRRMHAADLIFRVDPNLESFLKKSLRSIDGEKIITLSNAPKMTLLKVFEEHTHDEHNDHEEEDERQENDHKDHEESKEHENEATNIDYHLWLSPDNAVAMANNIRDALIKIAPEHKEQLTKNAERLINGIQEKNKAITEQLESVKETPFLVMHDAWQYFTKHYQLKQLGSISAQERLKASAKSLSAARETISKSNVQCLLAEPNLKRRTLTILTEDLPIQITEIDPLGREIPDSPQAYPELLQYTADKLLNCLKNK